MSNDKFVQIHGPFRAGEELVDIIKRNFNNFYIIKRIGIQAPETHKCYLNGQFFEIGNREILELEEVSITSVRFYQDELATTLVDCILG